MFFPVNSNKQEIRRKTTRNFTDASLLLCDANTFADVLGVSPSYRQKESFRWNSAMQVYNRLSSQDLSNGFLLDDPPMRTNAARRRSSAIHEDSATLPSSLPLSPTASPPPIDTIARMSCKRNSVPSMFNPRVLFSVRYNEVGHGSLPKEGASPTHSVAVASPADHGGQGLRLSTVVDGHEFAFNVNRRCASSLDLFDPTGHKNGIRSGRGRSADVVRLDDESCVNALELEAIAAVHELQFAVRDIFVSDLLPRTGQLIFLNVTTSEGQPHCIELTAKGWRVTSLRHDCMNGDLNFIELHTKYFETVYALMDHISGSYKHTFSAALASRLLTLVSVDHENDAVAADPTSTCAQEGSAAPETTAVAIDGRA